MWCTPSPDKFPSKIRDDKTYDFEHLIKLWRQVLISCLIFWHNRIPVQSWRKQDVRVFMVHFWNALMWAGMIFILHTTPGHSEIYVFGFILRLIVICIIAHLGKPVSTFIAHLMRPGRIFLQFLPGIPNNSTKSFAAVGPLSDNDLGQPIRSWLQFLLNGGH